MVIHKHHEQLPCLVRCTMVNPQRVTRESSSKTVNKLESIAIKSFSKENLAKHQSCERLSTNSRGKMLQMNNKIIVKQTSSINFVASIDEIRKA